MYPNGSTSNLRISEREPLSRTSKGEYLTGPRSFDLARLFDSFGVRSLGIMARSTDEVEGSVATEIAGDGIMGPCRKDGGPSGTGGAGLRRVLRDIMIDGSVCQSSKKSIFRRRPTQDAGHKGLVTERWMNRRI